MHASLSPPVSHRGARDLMARVDPNPGFEAVASSPPRPRRGRGRAPIHAPFQLSDTGPLSGRSWTRRALPDVLAGYEVATWGKAPPGRLPVDTATERPCGFASRPRRPRPLTHHPSIRVCFGGPPGGGPHVEPATTSARTPLWRELGLRRRSSPWQVGPASPPSTRRYARLTRELVGLRVMSRSGRCPRASLQLLARIVASWGDTRSCFTSPCSPPVDGCGSAQRPRVCPPQRGVHAFTSVANSDRFACVPVPPTGADGR